ncbi:MAG: hypothetical protein ACD_46C00566G0004 [uncultured bacterium]|nr:MAG: hypothetical protein ACD_46C00566G0004 [uncultured bacterium]
MRQVILLGLCLIITGCAGKNYYTQTVQSWKGGSAKNLVSRWGSPDDSLQGAGGMTYYLYKTESYHTYNTPSSPSVGLNLSSDGRPVMTTAPNTNLTWNRDMSLTCNVIFAINSQGTIVDTRIQGTTCYGSEGFAKRLSNPSVGIVKQAGG